MRLSLLIVSVTFSFRLWSQNLFVNPGWVASLTPPCASKGSFYPTNIVNTIAFWNYHDAPLGSTLSWTDEVSHLVWMNLTPTYDAPTNTGLGWYLNGTSGFTNITGLSNGPNFSIWCVLANVDANYYAAVIGNWSGSPTPAQDAIYFTTFVNSPSNVLLGNWSGIASYADLPFGYVYQHATVTNPPFWYDVVDSQGTIYTNGVDTTSNISKPRTNIWWQQLGQDGCTATAFGFAGNIKYVLISTNHAITTTEASNLWVWDMTNGVTNVDGGLVAWWKFNDGSGSSVLGDSSGHGWNGRLLGNPQPAWGSGLNPVVNGSLTFDGVQNTVFAAYSGRDFSNSHLVTFSMWFQFTDGASEGSFFAAYDSNWFPTARTGSSTFGVWNDAPGGANGLIRGGVGADNGIYGEANGLYTDDGIWHHYAVGTDGTNYSCWIDGVRVFGSIKGPTPAGWWNGWTNFQFSAMNVSAYEPCTLTDIRIYNRILNDAEVDILYRSPTADLIRGSYDY